MIIKSENKSDFTILSNAVLLDETISDKARGVLVRLLCRPENWNLNIKHLVKTGKDGNAAVRSAVRELEDAGYIHKEITRHENGRIIGIEYTVCESKGPPTLDETMPKSEQINEELTAMPEPLCQVDDIQEEIIEVEVVEPATSNKNTSVLKTDTRVTDMPQIAPIINTDIKQILRETTTTRAREAEPEVCDQTLPVLSSSSSTNEIINLIPEQHRSPVVLSLVSKAIVDYPEKEVKEAVAYAAGNVRGGSMQFKAYLDKTLKNKWAEGYLDAMDSSYILTKSFPHLGKREYLDAMDSSYPFGPDLFGGGHFPNGFSTGSKRLDGNLAACLGFAAYCENRKEATA